MEKEKDMEAVQADSEKILHFMDIYCRAHHAGNSRADFEFNYPRIPVSLKEGVPLCGECTRLARHAIVMRYLCPLDPKPKCRNCPEHCYRPEYREEMQVVMKYVGPRLIFARK